METTRISTDQSVDALGTVSERLSSSGTLSVARITKQLRSEGDELVFAAAPARVGTTARRIVVHFVYSAERPAPRLDASTGIIDLYYPQREHAEAQALLNSRKQRFCYFWESTRGHKSHAWILSAP